MILHVAAMLVNAARRGGFRTKGDLAVVGAGFQVSRATAYRYRDEDIRVLAAQAPDLHEALQRWPNRAGRTSCSTAS